MRTTPSPAGITLSLAGLLALSGCGEPEEGHGKLAGALSATFSATSPLCPATSSWSAWSQTSLSTWDGDVQPVVQWIINRTGISSSTYSGHSPSIGRAADWRPHSREEGTELANWFLANTKSGGAPLGIDYIIWQAEIYLPSSGGVKPMEDRGSFTQNHCDHIHISFVKKGSVNFAPASTTPWGDPPPPDAGPEKDTSPPPLPPDAGPPPVQQPDASPPPSSLDAGVPSPPVSPEPAPAAPEEEPATAGGELVGGCALQPVAPRPADAAWLLLLALLARARRARPLCRGAISSRIDRDVSPRALGVAHHLRRLLPRGLLLARAGRGRPARPLRRPRPDLRHPRRWACGRSPGRSLRR